jgi:SWIM zinc finger
MATTSLPASREEATTRVQRGRGLYAERWAEFRFDPDEKVWLVPSQHDGTSVYEVVLGRRGESCECRDFEFRGGPCLHIYAATIAKSKTTTCNGCGLRFRHPELEEVTEDHESLTWFVGDLLCPGCHLQHGGIA